MKGHVITALASLAGMALFLRWESTQRLGILCGLVCLITCSSGWLNCIPRGRRYW